MRIFGGRATIGRSADAPERADHATQTAPQTGLLATNKARTDPRRTPDKLRAFRRPRRQTAIGLSSDGAHLPVPAATCRSGVQTNLGLAPSSPSSPVSPVLTSLASFQHSCPEDGLRAYGPHLSIVGGGSPAAASAAIAAAPGEFNAPLPKRRTSPVMTNDRVSLLNPGAERRRNGSAIRRSISCGSPRHPLCVFVPAS